MKNKWVTQRINSYHTGCDIDSFGNILNTLSIMCTVTIKVILNLSDSLSNTVLKPSISAVIMTKLFVF